MTDGYTTRPPRWIEYVRLEALVPAVRNAKLHKPEQIAASIKRHGFVAVPIRDERTGRLVAGHGRIEALELRALSGQGAPEGCLVDTDGGWLVPVECGWSSVDDGEAEAYLVGDNELSMLAGWDRLVLAESLADIAMTPDGLAGTGFNAFDLHEIMASLTAGADAPPADSLPDDGSVLIQFRVQSHVKDRLTALLQGIQGDTPCVVTICEALEAEAYR